MSPIRASFACSLMSLLFAALASAAAPTGSAFVERFTPQGIAKDLRQVSARFAAPMVALGDPRLADPFDVDCSATGTGRWADSRNWVYDFDTDLAAGERCAFTLRADVRTLAGATPSPRDARRRFDFTTGGPAIVGSHPYEGSQEVDEQQIFLLKLDAVADAASIRANARCIVEGIGEQIPVEVVEGETRAALLRERAALGFWYYRLLWKTGAESRLRVRDSSLERAEQKIVLARCQRPLPPGASVQLLWGAGIATASGIASTDEQRLAFRVRNAFTAQAQCTRANAQAGCLPMLPITVQFNAPVAQDRAAAVRLKLANGRLLAPQIDPAPADRPAGTVDSVRFAPPFAEKQPVQVSLPPGFVDDAGRPLENAQRFPLDVRVDAFPPLAKFSGNFGILEAKEGGILPVTVRNLEATVLTQRVEMPARLLRLDGDPAKVAAWIRRVEEAGESRGEVIEPAQGAEEDDDGPRGEWREDTGNRSVFVAGEAPVPLPLPRPGNGKATEVIGIPLKQPSTLR